MEPKLILYILYEVFNPVTKKRTRLKSLNQNFLILNELVG